MDEPAGTKAWYAARVRNAVFSSVVRCPAAIAIAGVLALAASAEPAPRAHGTQIRVPASETAFASTNVDRILDDRSDGDSARLPLIAAIPVYQVALSAGGGGEYKIIVNPDNPIVAIDRQFLRDAYLRKSTGWAHGDAIRPVDLARSFPVRERFTQEVLRKSPSQLRSYWNQLIFSGKGVPPPEVNSVDAVVRHVRTDPGAIGYLPVDAEEGGVKVVRVE